MSHHQERQTPRSEGVPARRRGFAAVAAVATASALAAVSVATLAAVSVGPLAPAWAVTGPAFTVGQIPGSGYGPSDPVVALTFDDGPDPTWTPQVLAALARSSAPATFFELGWEVAAYPGVTRQVAAADDPVENHTWHHVDLTRLALSMWPAEVDRTSAAIASLTGRAVTCLRPPYDAMNPTVVSLAAQRGLAMVSYSTDTGDWRRPGVAQIVTNALAGLRNGSILAFHDGGGNRSETVAALPAIVEQIRARGYRLVRLCTPRPYSQQATPFGDAAPLAAPGPTTSRPVGAAATPGRGLWTASADGTITVFGDARALGSAAGWRLAASVVGMAVTADGGGYWLVGADGGVFSFGDAVFRGSAAGRRLAASVVGMAATADGGGYWLVGADGGVFSFGDAVFRGSGANGTSGLVTFALAPSRSGNGYWLVAERLGDA